MTKLTEKELIKIEEQLIKLRTKQLNQFKHKSNFSYLMYNLLEGIMRGIGFFIGGTLIVGLVSIILSKYFTSIPLIGSYITEILNIINQNQQNNIDI